MAGLVMFTIVSVVLAFIALVQAHDAEQAAHRARLDAYDAKDTARRAEATAKVSVRRRLIDEVDEHARRQARLDAEVREFRGAIDAARGKRSAAS